MSAKATSGMFSRNTVEAIYGGIDWLTLTTDRDARDYPYLYRTWQATIESIAKEGNKLQQRTLQGYQGMSSGNCFVGDRPGGLMIQLSGAYANEHFDSVWRSDCNVPRLDVQITVRYKNERFDIAKRQYNAYTRASAGGTPPKFKYHLRTGSDGGDTLYIGSTNSEQFGRLYNKAVQSQAEEYERSWRWEVQLKNDLARDAARTVSKGVDERAKWARAFVVAWYGKRRCFVPVSPGNASYVLPLLQKRPTDVQSKLDWLEKQVKPTITFLTEQGYTDSIYTALGLPSLSNTHLDDPGVIVKGE